MNAHLDGTGLDAEQCRDLLVGHASITSKDDQLALVFAQLQERALQPGSLPIGLEAAHGARPWFRPLQRLGRERLHRLTAPEVVGAGVPGNPEQPRLEAAAVAVGRAVLQDADEA